MKSKKPTRKQLREFKKALAWKLSRIFRELASGEASVALAVEEAVDGCRYLVAIPHAPSVEPFGFSSSLRITLFSRNFAALAILESSVEDLPSGHFLVDSLSEEDQMWIYGWIWDSGVAFSPSEIYEPEQIMLEWISSVGCL